MPYLFEAPLTHESARPTPRQTAPRGRRPGRRGPAPAPAAPVAQPTPQAPAVPRCNPTLDEKALSIIGVAERARRGGGSLQWAAQEIVWRIIREYFPLTGETVRAVAYRPDVWIQSTLQGGADGRRSGTIYVGDKFVQLTTRERFPIRVAEVHRQVVLINLHANGDLVTPRGDPMSPTEREFYSFQAVALIPEPEGAGCLPDDIRRNLIDFALGYYNCLPAARQAWYARKRDDLLARRQTVNGTPGTTPPTLPPTGCQRTSW